MSTRHGMFPITDVVLIVVVYVSSHYWQCGPLGKQLFSHTLTLFLHRFITIFPNDSASSSFDLRTLRAVKVLRPLRLVSGIPSTYEAAFRIHFVFFAPLTLSPTTFILRMLLEIFLHSSVGFATAYLLFLFNQSVPRSLFMAFCCHVTSRDRGAQASWLETMVFSYKLFAIYTAALFVLTSLHTFLKRVCPFYPFQT